LVDQLINSRNYSAPILKIVLDNVVAGIQMGSAWSTVSIGLATCAYILVLCHHLKLLGRIKQDQKIELYDGWFQNFDGAHIQRFVNLFVKSMKRISQTKAVTLNAEKSEFTPTQFNAHLGLDAEIRIHTNSTGVKSPYVSMAGKNYFIEEPGVTPDPDLVAICEQVRFPHNKAAFVANVETMKKQSRPLWYLNFLRDCLRAEMAISKQAVYITHDRLAYLYYKLIGGESGSGFLLNISSSDNPYLGIDYEIDTVVYRVTV